MTLVEAATRPSLHQRHTLICFVLTLVFLAAAVLPQLFVNRSRGWERRVYWTGSTAATLCAFLASLPDWKLAIAMSLFIGGGMVFTAYAYTPYIRIRGNVHAFTVADSQPEPPPNESDDGSSDPDYDPAPDSYGGIATAKKSWWVMILAMVICTGNVAGYFIDDQKPLLAVVMAAAIVVAAIGYGYGDASWGYPIARGQRVQFAIVAVITAGVFTVLYLGAYYAGKRRPLRRKQSMEYRAHPRHQKR